MSQASIEGVATTEARCLALQGLSKMCGRLDTPAVVVQFLIQWHHTVDCRKHKHCWLRSPGLASRGSQATGSALGYAECDVAAAPLTGSAAAHELSCLASAVEFVDLAVAADEVQCCIHTAALATVHRCIQSQQCSTKLGIYCNTTHN